MTKLFTILFIILGLFYSGPCNAETSLHISFHQNSEITDNVIYLGDIAEIIPKGEAATRLGRLEVTLAPRPGNSKNLFTKPIISRLINHTSAPVDISDNTPEQISISRQGTIITGDQLKSLLAAFLQDHLRELPPAQVRIISFKPPKDFILPTGKLRVEILPSQGDIITSSSFNYIFSINGSTVKNLSVPTKLEAVGQVAVAATTIRKGDLIRPEQITTSTHNLARLRGPLPDLGTLIGMRAKKTISRGRVIETRWVETPPLINKGRPVKIMAVKGAIFLSTLGVALSDGRMGEMIRVENLKTNKLLFCRVTSSNTVRVEF
ncbi:MAG: flagellar basal body P-ring formation chaperone FlgA [Desulfobulbaceae bacterium]|nr:flagellar basal body P-ring formation chaperone FlgA [Desulfobulbaceae bacterium]